MPQFKAINPQVEVNGQTIYSVMHGLKAFKEIAEEILADNGLVDVQADGWYLQQAWLDSFKTIAEEIGENTLFNIGKSIPDNAKFPPGIETIEQGLSLIDVAYHMNHRLNGKIMFDPATGAKAEGIGSYNFVPTGPNSGKVYCPNPYPCDFDRGIVTAMARKFKPLAEVKLDETVESRKKGGESSTYLVTW